MVNENLYSSTISDQEIAREKIAKAKKRMVFLFLALVLLAGIRLVVKNPPKPKIPDHSKIPFKALPGVLANLPVSEQMKLTPQMVSALREADLKEEAKKAPKLAEGPYVPANTPLENLKEKVENERLMAAFEKKRKHMDEEHKIVARDLTKNTLVLFKTGGFLKAESAAKSQNTVEIVYDKTTRAQLPRELVASIKGDAVDWEEPIPRGFVKIQPAKGITIVVAKDTSERISVLKIKKDNEI